MASKKSYKSTAKKAAKQAKKHPKLVIALVILLVIIIVAIAVLWYFKPEFFHKFLGTGEHTWTEWETTDATCGEDGLKKRSCTVCGEEQSEIIPKTGKHNIVDGKCTVCGYIVPEGGSLEGVANSDLSIHFLELGNGNAGDCTLIKCGNTEVLIDAGSKRNSTETVKNYIDKYCTDGVLEYVVVTHAHEDHIAALVGEEGKNNGVLYSYEIDTVIQFAGHNTTSKIYNDYVSAVNSCGASVFTAKECWYESKQGAQKSYYLDKAETISLNILYQRYYDDKHSKENNYSVCTLLTQVVNAETQYNYLFTGDLEEAGEKSLVASNNLPEVELFKGGHHGSSTSSNDVLLNVIKPKNIAICTCAGTYEYADKPTQTYPVEQAKLNTFPTQEALDRMSKHTQNIYVTTLGILGTEKDEYATAGFTSMNGNIIFYTENGKLKLYCSNNDTVLKDTEWFAENRVWNGIR